MKKIIKFLINFIPIRKYRHKIRNRVFLKKYKQLNKKISIKELTILNFMYTTNTSNVGDLASSPLNYFDFGTKNISHDIVKTINNNIVYFSSIIGGGIHSWLFQNYEFYRRINFKNNIAWGIGTFYLEKYPEAVLNKFSLIGLREANSPMIDNKKIFYCPCASCMYSLFDIKYKVNNDVIFYLHQQFTDKEFFNSIKQKYPTLDNYNNSFYEVIKFLSSGNTVITNSYHGMYWATLLGKKVVCIDIHNKCKGIKWLPVFADYNNWKEKIENAQTYSTALKEARLLNINFYNKVIGVLNES